MQQLITKHQRDISGVLSGWDRVRFRGTIRRLAFVDGLWGWLNVQRVLRKCLHWYVYFVDPVLGLSHVRIQSWLPFTVHVCVNGREWLCRQLDAAGIGYTRSDNCLLEVDDVAAALQQPYPSLLRHALTTFSSRDVMRFLGRTRLPAGGRVDLRFNGQVVTDLRPRPEGLRIKHRMNRNSLKMYDQQGSVLRVETTINDARGLFVHRASETDPTGPKTQRRLRKGVVDLPRRAEISQAANKRYLTPPAEADTAAPLGKLADQVRTPVVKNGRRFRGLQPVSGPDATLSELVLRGQFALNGFRNRDLRTLRHPQTNCPQERRRQSNRSRRPLRLFREHGLIRQVKGTHRYQLTASGRRVLPAFVSARNARFVSARNASSEKLNTLAT